MGETAEVIVKNRFKGWIVNVSREMPDGSVDGNTDFPWPGEEKVILPDPDTLLIIKAPGGTDIRDCPIKILSDVDLIVNHSRSSSSWQMKIAPNDLPPQVPTTVNVNIGEDEPE